MPQKIGKQKIKIKVIRDQTPGYNTMLSCQKNRGQFSVLLRWELTRSKTQYKFTINLECYVVNSIFQEQSVSK